VENVSIYITYGKNKNVQMSIQKTLRIKKIESNFVFDFLGQHSNKQQAIQHADPELYRPRPSSRP
jgi:hypothetical protein